MASSGMAKRHYETIAAAFAGNINPMRKAAAMFPNDGNLAQRALLEGAEKMAADIADDLATAFARDNETFDRARFLRACNVKQEA
jgi:hypothetical protein